MHALQLNVFNICGNCFRVICKLLYYEILHDETFLTNKTRKDNLEQLIIFSHLPLGYVKLYLLFCIVRKKFLHIIRWSILLDIIIHMLITELDL